MINSLGCTVFIARVSEVGKIQPYSVEKVVFWSTLEAPSEKTMYLQELVMVFKVINKIVGIIHFD